jgi:hypothetical protein
MNRMFAYFVLFIFATLISGLAGCSNHSKNNPSDSSCTTQPTATQAACTESTTAEESIDMPVEENRHPMERQADRMIHNAELADMVLADIHFLPHRETLNSTGTQRLNHLAWLVERYGGTIKLDLKEPKSELAKARTKTVEAYLKTWGLPADKIKVEIGLSENEGMDAKEGIDIHNSSRAGKNKDKQEGTTFSN